MDGQSTSERVVPLETFTTADQNGDADELPPQCTLVLPPHKGLVNPEVGDMQKEGRDAERFVDVPEPSYFSPAMHLLMAGGKRSAGICLEGRGTSTGEAVGAVTGCSIYDVVHPAPLTFMRGLKQD